MRVNINMNEELVARVDEIAKKMYISRSSYIAMAVTAKLQQDSILDNMPSIIATMQEMNKKMKEIESNAKSDE